MHTNLMRQRSDDRTLPVRRGAALAVCLCFALAAGPASADPLDEELITVSQIGGAKGIAPDAMKGLIGKVQEAHRLGLRTEPLIDKIKEGFAKGIEPERIEQRLKLMIAHMKLAAQLLKDTRTGAKNQTSAATQDRALDVLAEALDRGVTPENVRAVQREAEEGNREIRSDALAYGAKGLALMKEGGLPHDESHALISAALRRGVDSTSLLDLARELKQRGQEFRKRPALLREVRIAVEQGQHMEKILGDVRARSTVTTP